MKRSPRLQLSIENRILLPFVGISLLTMVAFLGLFLRNEYSKAVSAALYSGDILTPALRREIRENQLVFRHSFHGSTSRA